MALLLRLESRSREEKTGDDYSASNAALRTLECTLSNLGIELFDRHRHGMGHPSERKLRSRIVLRRCSSNELRRRRLSSRAMQPAELRGRSAAATPPKCLDREWRRDGT